ncbi:MAG: hypothetical protein JOZ69_06830, partial [Myxococcales bacterium]|nr:hypothetical protein [Myxococcales bacterium]
MRRASLRAGALGLGLLAGSLGSGSARAAPPWVERHLTLPAGDWAFNLGLGV